MSTPSLPSSPRQADDILRDLSCLDCHVPLVTFDGFSLFPDGTITVTCRRCEARFGRSNSKHHRRHAHAETRSAAT